MRTWLYRSDHPAGRIFDTEDAIAQALHDGWVDDPARVHDENPEDGNPDDGIDVEIEDVLTMTVPEVTEYINDQDDPGDDPGHPRAREHQRPHPARRRG